MQIGTTDKRGGASAIAWELKQYLESEKHTSTMFVADKLSKNVDVFTIQRKMFRRYLSFLLSTEKLYDTDWILKTTAFKNSDIVHAHNLHGRFFKLSTLQEMSLIKPVVWTLHDEWAITPHCAYTFEGTSMTDGFFDCSNKNVPPRLLWHNEKQIRKNKKELYDQSKFNIVVPSMWLKKRVEKSALGNQKISLIYNGVDTKKFKRLDKHVSREVLNLPQNKKIILFLADGGLSNPWKGWSYTMQVITQFQNNSNVLFLCVGNSDKSVFSDTHTNTRYEGYVDNAVLNQYYSASDMLITTTLADNFPLVVLEAMSCGLPIVSFETGGIPEAVIHKEHGYIAPYTSVEGVVKGIQFFLEKSVADMERIAENNQKRVEIHFNKDSMVREYMDLYKTLVS